MRPNSWVSCGSTCATPFTTLCSHFSPMSISLKIPMFVGARASCVGQANFAVKVGAERHCVIVLRVAVTLCTASFLRWAVLDIPSLITWEAISSSSAEPSMLTSNTLLWWILFLVPTGAFVCFQWALVLHRRFTRRIIKLPLFHRLTLGLISLLYIPVLFVHLRHVTCSSYSLFPAPVMSKGCSDMCNPITHPLPLPLP